jgi:hypothetical protein
MEESLREFFVSFGMFAILGYLVYIVRTEDTFNWRR